LGHDHAHHHPSPAGGFDRAFGFGIALNLGFVAVEAAYGFVAGSLALLADAGHNLSDVLGLALAWGAAWAARRAPTRDFTYGLRRTTILAALANAALLFLAVGFIAAEAIERLSRPQPVASGTVIAVAAIGIAINAATAMLFFSGRKHDINLRGAYLHMAADAAVSAGVVASGFLTLQAGRAWIDPATSLVVAAIVAFGTWGLLKASVRLALDAVPEGIDRAAVESFLAGLPGVAQVHHVHIWAMSTTEVALTAHLVRPGATLDDGFLRAAAHELEHRFGIGHATIQVETGNDRPCYAAAGGCV